MRIGARLYYLLSAFEYRRRRYYTARPRLVIINISLRASVVKGGLEFHLLDIAFFAEPGLRMCAGYIRKGPLFKRALGGILIFEQIRFYVEKVRSPDAN